MIGALTGFDPRAMLSLLLKLRTDEPSLASMHPTIDTRLTQASNMFGAARRVWQRVACKPPDPAVRVSECSADARPR